VLTLQPNTNQTLNFSWFPYSAGDYEIVARADAGNLISDASAGKQSSMHISVLPAEESNIFSVLPNGRLQNVGVINITANGISEVYNYLPTVQELQTQILVFVRPYIRNFKEVQIGTEDYIGGQHAIVIFVKGAASPQQLSSILSSFIMTQTGLNSTVQHKTLDGQDVSIVTSDGLPAPVCIWRDKGVLKLTILSDFVTYETCDSAFGTFDSSYADAPLSMGSELVREVPINTTLLGTTLHLSNLTNTTVEEYGAAFEDNEGFYGFYVTKEPLTITNATCVGRIINRSSMQVCETPPVNSTWAAAQRNVGNYSLACLGTPKTGTLTAGVEGKTIDTCFYLNYTGEERKWISILDLLHQARCELSNNFSCLSYEFSNASLKLNLTQNTGKTVVLNALGCSSQPNVSAASFQLPQPVTLPSNSSLTQTLQCYDNNGGIIQATYTYFDTKLYLNYSVEGSSESKVIVGNLTIRKI
jgi:hypothetical protein